MCLQACFAQYSSLILLYLIHSRGFHYTGGPLTEMLEAFSNEFAVHQIGGMMLRDLFAVSANLHVRTHYLLETHDL